jgi:hypothetical protein
MPRIYTFLALIALAAGASAQTTQAKSKASSLPRKDVLTPPPPPKALPASRAINPAAIRAGEDDWRFADPAASVIGSVNLEALATSPLVQGVIEQIAQDLAGGAESFRSALHKTLGRSGVRRISFSIKEATGEPVVLALLTGKMDENELAKLAQGKVEFRRLGLENVLAGYRSDLQWPLRRLSLPRPAVSSALLQEGKVLAMGNDIWLAGSLAGLNSIGGFRSPVRKISFGLNVRQDIDLNLRVDTGDSKAALDFAQKAEQSQTELPEGTSLAASVEGSAVRLRLAVNGDRVGKFVADAWKGQAKGELAKMLEGINLSALAGTAPTTPPRPRKAVIYGLEDGPKEVPLR